MPYLLDGYVSHLATRSFSERHVEEAGERKVERLVGRHHAECDWLLGFQDDGPLVGPLLRRYTIENDRLHCPDRCNLQNASNQSILDPDHKVKHKFSTCQPLAYGSLQRAGSSSEQVRHEAQTPPTLRLPNQLRPGNIRR